MAVIKCKMCGGDLILVEGQSVAECEYCGSKQTVPSGDNEKKLTLFGRAGRLRAACEFDKAAGIYEAIVADFPEEAEAYWGLVLCKYGIEYVDDPATGKKIPTCHRSSFDSIMEDSDFEQALENADAVARRVYRKEAKQIEEIRKGIIAVSANEQPYDIFICYKETDENGGRTLDSVLAQDIYDALTEKGYRTFFARISLEDKLGVEYEPYIFAALNSAKIMLAVGTGYEFYNAVWVKNEWSRYLKLMTKDKTKHLIPCYKGINVYDMPKEFAKLQAQDLGKVGAMQDLLRGIEKMLPKKAPQAPAVKEIVREKTLVKEVIVKETIVAGMNPHVNALLERVFQFLEDRQWFSAYEYCERVLDIDPKNANAYLGKLLAEYQLRWPSMLIYCEQPFERSKNYRNALRYGDDEMKAMLTGYVEKVKELKKLESLDNWYKSGYQAMTNAKTESDYKSAAKYFEWAKDYKDAKPLARKCCEKAEIARKDAILDEGKEKMNSEVIADCEAAIGLFESIRGWKNEKELTAACKRKLKELKAKEEAERLKRERREELERKEAEERTKRNKKRVIIATSIICAAIVFVIVHTTLIAPALAYSKAEKLMAAGQYRDAIIAFIQLENYKESQAKVEELISQQPDLKLYTSDVGDTFTFGKYEQDKNTDGMEDIEWVVLDKKGSSALVISKYVLDYQRFCTNQDAKWEECALRTWLNDDFFNKAFTAEEREMIQKSEITSEIRYGSTEIVTDFMFLLSEKEAELYFSSNAVRQALGTKYVLSQINNNDSQTTNWWLRNRDDKYGYAFFINVDGKFFTGPVDRKYGIRPSMWIKLLP